MNLSRTVAFAVLLLVGDALAKSPAAKNPCPTPQAMADAKQHWDKGKLFYNAALYDDAVKEFQQAYVVCPQPDFLYNIGQSFRLAKKPEQALEAYSRYVSEYPQGADLPDVQAQMAEVQKQIDEAKSHPQPPENPPPVVTPPPPPPPPVVIAPPPVETRHPNLMLRRAGFGLVGAGFALTALGAGLLGWASVTVNDYDSEYMRCFPGGTGVCPSSSTLGTLHDRYVALDIAGPILMVVGVAVMGAGGWMAWANRPVGANAAAVPPPSTGSKPSTILFAPTLYRDGAGVALTWTVP